MNTKLLDCWASLCQTIFDLIKSPFLHRFCSNVLYSDMILNDTGTYLYFPLLVLHIYV